MLIKDQMELVKSIKQNTWMALTYSDENKGETKFWCRIFDIHISEQMFIAELYNYNINNTRVIDKGYLYYNKIKSCKQIEGTTGEDNSHLITKIETAGDKIFWLQYDQFNSGILDYYAACSKYEKNIYIEKYSLIESLDNASIRQNCQLNDHQFVDIINKIYNKNLSQMEDKKNDSYIEQELSLGLNVLGISLKNNKFFCILYHMLKLDLKNHKMIMSKDVYINHDFIDNNIKYSISKYIEINIEYFVEDFRNNPQKYIEDIQKKLKKEEYIDERPYLFILKRDNYFDYQKEYQPILELQQQKKLATPMISFFGNMTKKKQRSDRKTNPITLLDNQVDFDQLRVIFNASTNPITYVQGPPGTGKTQTILNIIVSALYNKKTILVCSHNNKPLKSIIDKIEKMTYKTKNDEKSVLFPYFRAGNNEEILDGLARSKTLYDKYKRDFYFDKKEENEKYTKKLIQKSANAIEKTNLVLSVYEEKEELIIRKNTLLELYNSLPDLKKILLDDELEKINKRISEIGEVDVNAAKENLNMGDEVKRVIHYQTIDRIKLLKQDDFQEISKILEIEDEIKRRSQFNKYIKTQEGLNKLLKVFPIIFTTNLSAPKLGNAIPTFDIVIMDEAGQCSPNAALFSICRGKSLVLVGDENQLQPVCTLDSKLNKLLMNEYMIKSEYNYFNNSILNIMQTIDHISNFIIMRHHYRSKKKIIDFSNKRYYECQLKIENNDNSSHSLEILKLKTSNQNEKNSCIEELEAIKNHIKTYQLDESKIGIITPFHNQADKIEEYFKDYKNLKFGTVHTFQGDEKDIIYLSLAITPSTHEKAYEWMSNNRELINVATTRAKEKLVLVGDIDEITKRNKDNDDINSLVQYILSNGNIETVKTNSDQKYSNKLNCYSKYNTLAENEFVKTVSHYLSTNNKLVGKEHVKVSKVLQNYTNELFDYYTRAEFDYVLYEDNIPVLVIEIDGIEHYTNLDSQQRDKMKEELCALNGLKLIRIPNINVKRYEFIKENIEFVLQQLK